MGLGEDVRRMSSTWTVLRAGRGHVVAEEVANWGREAERTAVPRAVAPCHGVRPWCKASGPDPWSQTAVADGGARPWR